MSSINKSFKFPIILGELLRDRRKEHKSLLREAAAQVNMDTSLLGHIERGTRLPTAIQAEELAKHYGLEINTIQALRLVAELQRKESNAEILRHAGKFLTGEVAPFSDVNNT